ncbi:MAG: class I SAM-dependent methyltransferase, partial [Anaerolineaceae bacterium]
MNDSSSGKLSDDATVFFFNTVCCPRCFMKLKKTPTGGLECSVCGKTYSEDMGIIDLYLENTDEKSEKINLSNVEKTETIFVNSPQRIASQTGLEQRAGYWNSFVELRHINLLKDVLDNAIFLDAGCGTGNLIKHIHPTIFGGIGIDASMKSLKMASEKCPHDQKTIFIRANCLNMPFFDNSFDVISSSEVIEHIPDPNRYLSEIFRVLKHGGYATLSTPSAYINLFPYPWNIFKMVTSPS